MNCLNTNRNKMIRRAGLSINSGIANAPHADFAGEVLTPPLTKGNIVPSGLPYFLSAIPQRADGEFQIKALIGSFRKRYTEDGIILTSTLLRYR